MALIEAADDLIPETPDHRIALARLERRTLITATVIAVLFHILLIALCVLDWDWILARAPKPQPEAIPVALINLPPPAPPAPPTPPAPAVEPKPPEPAPPPQVKPRMSGDSDKTEAAGDTHPALPPTQTAPEPPKPKRPTVPKVQTKEPITAKGETKAANDPTQTARAEPRKETQEGSFIHSITLHPPGGGTGKEDSAGDPYLNRLKDRIEQNRIFPPASAFPGGGARLAVFSVVLEPTGDLSAITLIEPTGSNLLDEAAGRMIRVSTPFPPFPLNYPNVRVLIKIAIPIYPERQ